MWIVDLMFDKNDDLYISNHDLDDFRLWMCDKYHKMHNTSTIERAFREMREKGEIDAIDATLPGKKEKRWLIQNT